MCPSVSSIVNVMEEMGFEGELKNGEVSLNINMGRD